MTILDRNFGVVTSASTTWAVSRSTGSYGTGTQLAVVIFSNTTFSTPAGWTQSGSSVVTMGNYSFDKTAAGESTINFTNGAAGTGVWFAWELSAGSSLNDADLNQSSSGSSWATPDSAPTAGFRHLLAVVGGNSSTTPRTITAWTASFVATGHGGHAGGGDQTFAYSAELDVTADGIATYATTGTFNGSAQFRGGAILAYASSAGDVTPPTVPTGLTSTAIGSTTVDLSWLASTDDVAVTGYEIQVIGP